MNSIQPIIQSTAKFSHRNNQSISNKHNNPISYQASSTTSFGFSSSTARFSDAIRLHANLSPLLLVSSGVAHDVQQQRIGREIHAVVRASDRSSNVLCSLPVSPSPSPHVDSTQLDEARVVLHGLTDQSSRCGLSLGTNDGRLLVLLRLLHHVLGTLGLLLRWR